MSTTRTINLSDSVQGTTSSFGPGGPGAATVPAGGAEALVATILVGPPMASVMVVGTPSGPLTGFRIAIAAVLPDPADPTVGGQLTVLNSSGGPVDVLPYTARPYGGMVLWSTPNLAVAPVTGTFGALLDVSVVAAVYVYATAATGCTVTVDAGGQRH